MYLAFTLTMPVVASWDGKWSGSNKFYCVVKRFNKKESEKYKSLAGKSYGHRWSDGWFASVKVEEIDSETAKKLRKQSNGFLSYDWMISNILDHGTTYDLTSDQLFMKDLNKSLEKEQQLSSHEKYNEFMDNLSLNQRMEQDGFDLDCSVETICGLGNKPESKTRNGLILFGSFVRSLECGSNNSNK